MSMTAYLHKDNDGMYAYCPACGEEIEVYEEDECGEVENGVKEYYVECPECGQSFYASTEY